MPQIKVNEIRLVNKYRTEKPSFSSRPRNTHIFGIQLSGKYTHRFGKAVLTAEAGTVLFINKNSNYRVITEAPGISVSFHFTAFDDSAVPTEFSAVKTGGDIEKIFLGAYDLWKHSGGAADYELYEKMYAALSCAARTEEKMSAKYISSGTRTAAADAIAYINSHFNEKINIAELAALSGKSTRRFNDIFKAATGQTPLEYINNLKLDAAKSHLESGTYTVSEIAHILGFDDESYFNRLFSRKVGIPPGKYRAFITETAKK